MSPQVHVIGPDRLTVAPNATVIGGKAANLVRLQQIGLRVPPAIVLDTSVSRAFLAHGTLPGTARDELITGVRALEAMTGLQFGQRRPLVVSVRSSPPVSMPGMLESVLNVGLTDGTVGGLIRRTGTPWLAWDSYRRLVLAFADTVQGYSLAPFLELQRQALASHQAVTLHDLSPLELRDLARRSADLYGNLAGAPFPTDPTEQVILAVSAVLRSWTAPRAREYRRLNHLSDDTGTAVIVQAMVFGNAGARSGSGVGFTRNPATGQDELYVDFVFNGQGEDVVSGRQALLEGPALPAALPEVWAQLIEAKALLEQQFRDMQDFEFTVEDGELFFLQTRTGKRAPWAALRIAAAFVREGLLEPSDALARLEALSLDRLERVVLAPGPNDLPVARATPASAGVASGALVLDAGRAAALASSTPVILVRTELATDDLSGMAAASGLLTTFGGRTSHAAVVARQLGKVCLVGCTELSIQDAARTCLLGGHRLHEGDPLTLDADHGFVYAGVVPTVRERPDSELADVQQWRRAAAAAADA